MANNFDFVPYIDCPEDALYTPPCNTDYVKRTVIYADGTLIINETLTNQEANIAKHGEAVNVYEPLNDNGTNYVWTEEPHSLWHESWSVETSIKRIEIGSYISPISTTYWFYNLRNCEKIDLTNMDTSRVTEMKSMFRYVGYNTSTSKPMAVLDLSHFDTRAVTDMSNMFNHMVNTKVIDVSSWVTSAVTNMDYIFGYCNGTETIYASSSFVVPDQRKYGYFVDCFNLVGGNGTSFSSIGGSEAGYSTYARIDNPPSNKGYFTRK